MNNSNSVSFFLNGDLISIDNPDPNLLLIDFLKSPQLNLSGAKKGCGQGGCGACTVILSHWNKETNKPMHRSINSCLRPVCSLQGLAVTTVEGTGAATRIPPKNPQHVLAPSRGGVPLKHRDSEEITEAKDNAVKFYKAAIDTPCEKKQDNELLKQIFDSSINPVAFRLAENNGSQCGYCSTGFVMNMSAFLSNTPKPTKKQIEEAFDGNICRCTGYRPILTAMKTFAVDWSKEDEDKRMKCLLDDQVSAQLVGRDVDIPFPDAAKNATKDIMIENTDKSWLSPVTIDELIRLFQVNTAQNKSVYLLNANTAFGIYNQEFLNSEVLISLAEIPELKGIKKQENKHVVGASTTYTEFFEYLTQLIGSDEPVEKTGLDALQFMAHRTAGTIVRNAATLAGNSMLVLKHIAEGTGEPFPSDLFTVLSALNVDIHYVNLHSGDKTTDSVHQLLEKIVANPGLSNEIVLLHYEITLPNSSDTVLAQKVALRDVNAHSIVNSTTIFSLSEENTIEQVNLTFGAIAPYPWRAEKTEKLLCGTQLSVDSFSKIAKPLADEVEDELARWKKRMSGLESEGFTDQYRIELVLGFVYKAIIHCLLIQDPKSVPKELQSAGEVSWGKWPVSDGVQTYKNQAYKAPVSQPYVKLMALYQTSGQVRYTHEMEVPPTAVNGAFVQSLSALANFQFIHPENKQFISCEDLSDYLKKKFPEFMYLITDKDVPKAGVNLQGMGADQPIFAEHRVSYVGQSLALAIAKNEQKASEIADYITQNCVQYSPVDWPEEWQQPIIGLDEAIAKGSIFPDAPKSASFVTHIWKIIRHDSQFGWLTTDKDPLDKKISTREALLNGGNCQVIESTQTCGGQIHFYMETQSCVALPIEAERLLFHPSSQSPMEMHQTAASVLGVEHNQVEVGIRQLGGGYGGKTEQAKFVIGAAAVAAKKLNKPVRLIMPRDNDTSMIGKRHPYYGQYQIAIDDGKNNPKDKGIIRGLDVNFYGDGGAFYDCSYIVSNCIQLRVDNAYKVENFQSTLDVCRTNTAPNTAFRSFGDIQGKLITENAIDDAAFSIGMDADEVREKNLYQRGDVTPFGQALSYCYIRDVWHYLKDISELEKRKKSVAEFNKNNRWRKRGIYMLPVKYGSGYNLVQLEQASAVVSVYSSDGTIIINQGGVDMGQGMVTKLEQIASYILNIPMDMIQIQFAKTDIIPNPTSTGGSTGTAYNGLAVKQTCERLRTRLTEFGYLMLKEKGNDWCRQFGIDFWNYGEEGWAATSTIPNTLVWQNLIAMAYSKRVSLIESFNAEIPGGTTPIPNMIYKPKELQKAIPGIELSGDEIGGEVDSFCGFTYSAACSEVEVDILTGEVKIIRTDLAYDMGWSLNPALDIGQVEGAFIQGVGYVTSEKLVFEAEGEQKGRLNTVNTWRYKPPATTNIPLEFNVHLFPRDLAEKVPENPNDLLSAKEVGEPPLVLAASVFFAIKAAIRESRLERGLSGLFKLDAPATVEEVRKACEVDFS